MDTTKFVLDTRQELLDYANDYSAYATRLSTRLRSTKKRLGVPDKNPAKHLSNYDISAAQLAQNHEFLHVPLLTAERCWAKSMAWQSRDTITADTRSNIVSKLIKAVKIVDKLVTTLSDSASGANTTDVLSAKAYAAFLKGDSSFRSKKWQECLENYSIAKVIYSALPSAKLEGNSFKDFVTGSVDSPLRYAQRQLHIPTTLSILSLAKKHFPQSDEALVSGVEEVAPGFLKQDEDADKAVEGARRTLAWRNRQVPVEDAEIALKLDALEAAASELSEKLGSSPDMRPNTKAESYDSVLELSNDAVDATQQAMDELREQSIAQGDPRMQNLAVLRTKLKYDLLSWQIGRNRVLMGEKDGSVLEDGPSMKKRAAGVEAPAIKESQQVKQLEKKVNLYNKTLQNLEVAKELPGVAADDHLAAEIDAVIKYFTALKSLATARSHTLIGNAANALALIKYAHDQCEAALPLLSSHNESKDTGLKTIEVVGTDAEFLQDLLKGELQRSRALVEISNLRKHAGKGDSKAAPRPLIDRLGQYPAEGVDLEKIVTYPPKMEPIPVKPLFLDVAWNYVQYPQEQGAQTKAPVNKANANTAEPEKQPAKKGWFGFGRG
ncbi:Laccase-4 [Cytospora mali]|uniref:Signal recognition particle subunit SRP68 n=1 Tax=Cytospora mali TaxID=578113 RepID=A0A194UTH4_CYTMA|nr:Laccase-4 [Valsa mali var. pyri (nom. inval.)]